MAEQEITRISDFATRAKISRVTVYNWIARGVLPRPVRYGPKLVAWPTSVIDEWFRAKAAAVAPPSTKP